MGRPTKAKPDDVSALHAELRRAFQFFNGLYWGGELPEPVITFATNAPNGARLGHFQQRTWEGSDGVLRDELVIYSDLALRAGILQVLQTLLHEMVHVWQENGHPAMTGKGKTAHHNERWHAEAQRVGLLTSGPKGYTKPTQQFRDNVSAFEPRTLVIPFRKEDVKGQGVTKGKLVKWTCGCGYGVRVAVAHFHARCLDCGQVYKRS